MGADALRGRVAVVTGAGTGLGAAIAESLAGEKADLVLQYRDHAAGVERTAATCRALGVRVETVQADFAQDAGRAAGVVDLAVERLGRVDVLVNNAAVTTRSEPLLAHSRELFEQVLAVNVVAPFLAAQACARHLASAGRGGRIINIGSVHGRQSVDGWTAYETSKGALEALTRSLAIALGPHGITVNCVAPGFVVVERYADADVDYEWALGRLPVGRLGKPADIAEAVRFLASDEAGFISGETLVVDGGMTRRMALAR
jgi:NAD(P)-dependent dehydrogenase (short-subunit alcohol dehydrogenase family)